MTVDFRSLRIIPAALVLAAALALPAHAVTLLVGPDQKLKLPSEAAKAAADGDTIEIEPMAGGYFDCAVWTANKLTIEGKGDGVTLTDKTCQGKALFVTHGNDITIRNITFTRARVPDKNGAGIRAEGVGLRIEKSRFINNENGILAADQPAGTIAIFDSEFRQNGKCDPVCSHGIYVGRLKLLHIEHSVFSETHQGHDVKSRALRTELVGDTIEDGPNGTSSYLVDIPNGGALVMRDDTLEKGPQSGNHSCAVSIGEEGVDQPTSEITIDDNSFTNDMSVGTLFVRNGTATDAVLAGNRFKGEVKPLSGDGSVK